MFKFWMDPKPNSFTWNEKARGEGTRAVLHRRAILTAPKRENNDRSSDSDAPSGTPFTNNLMNSLAPMVAARDRGASPRCMGAGASPRNSPWRSARSAASDASRICSAVRIAGIWPCTPGGGGELGRLPLDEPEFWTGGGGGHPLAPACCWRSYEEFPLDIIGQPLFCVFPVSPLDIAWALVDVPRSGGLGGET